MKNTTKNILIIIAILVLVIFSYWLMISILKSHFISNIEKGGTFKNNEFGDYLGGLINPLFTLLSTVAIIFLTYIIAKNEDVKSDKAIETQKRITLNQMRQTAFENLVQKTNLYVYELDKLSIHEAKNKFTQMVLTYMIKEKTGEQTNAVWLIIMSELENFTQFNYLFSGLFKLDDFKTKHEEMIDITSKLAQEQNNFKFVKSETIQNYINIQKDYLRYVGEYIYSEF
ncbi:MAG: hypothetical protein JJU34_02795 [Lunatimonas sp.]|uniref:hypothetical protein n=1 Tax=Lunatimonas sp. TaxID=2060141 RepID=UPI00263B6A7A|nr:hypothetical protein [Lunatimonas sp.]MCC5936188.1 hypothetical protein [Lunatimonas sp.]